MQRLVVFFFAWFPLQHPILRVLQGSPKTQPRDAVGMTLCCIFAPRNGCHTCSATRRTSTTGPAASTPPEQKSASDSTPIVAGVVSAVAGAALIALGVFLFLKRRRAAKQKTDQPPSVPPGHDDGNLEQGGDQPQDDMRPRTLSAPAEAVEGGRSPLHRRPASPSSDTPGDADGNGGGDINPKSALALPARPPALPARPVQSSTEHGKHAATAGDGDNAILAIGDRDGKFRAHQNSASPHRHTPAEADAVLAGDVFPPWAPAPFDGAATAAEYGGAGLADEEDAAVGSLDKSLTANSSIATASTVNMSTAEQEEVSEYRRREHEADAASVAGGPKPEGEAPGGGGTAASQAASRQSLASDIGLGQAVLAAAQELARSCQIPGVSEAAGAVCIMANLFSDSSENDKASASRLRQCRSIVLALQRADKVVVQVSRERGGFVVVLGLAAVGNVFKWSSNLLLDGQRCLVFSSISPVCSVHDAIIPRLPYPNPRAGTQSRRLRVF